MNKYIHGFSMLLTASLLIMSINGIGQQAPCVPAPADVTLGVIGEPSNIVVPQDQASVYANGREVPTIHEMLGVNLLKGNENSFHQMENLTDMFSHARLFQFQNKDYWDDGVGEPQPGDPSSYRIFTPYKDRNRLKLAVDLNGVPLVRNNVQPGDKMVYYDSTANQMMEEPLLSVYNVYTNYLNQNFHHAVSVYNEFQEPSHISLTVVPANFPQDIQSDYSFPSQWWTPSDWGVNYDQRFEAGRAYAMMFARTYAPKASDCTSCIKLVEVLEVGNEPWAYDADVYHAVIDGMIQGIEEYYDSDPSNKLLLIPAAYQAHHLENSNPVSFNYLDWKDYQGTRIPLDKKCYLHGTNLHPYSNDLADEGTGFYNQRLIAEPEKTSAANVGESKYLFVKNAWSWSNENMPAGSQHLYVSEFGWDSEVPECGDLNVTGVGEEAQGLYIIRATLMAARNGVHRAEAYEAIDNYASPCDFAYHSSGLWDRLNDGSVAQKESKEAVHKFVELTGDLKFNYAIVETAQEEYAYALEDASGEPVYLVGWLAENVNNLDWTTIDGITKSDIELDLNFNGTSYEVDAARDWYYLDNNITTDGSATVTDLSPINDITEVYDASTETFRFRPIPVLIPIGEIVDGLTCTGEVSPPTCFMSNDASITVSVLDGEAPYSYAWSHDASLNQAVATDLGAGLYTVFIEDMNGLSTSCDFEVIETRQIEITDILVTNATCSENNGALEIVAQPKDAESNSLLSYSIDNGDTFQENPMFTGLLADNYEIVVRDADGCTVRAMAQVSDENGAFISLAAACNGTAKIDVLAAITGGQEPYLIEWTGPDGSMYDMQNLTAVPEGSYMLKVTDANACVSMDMITLEDCCVTTNFCNIASIDPVCDTDLGVISLTSYGGLPPYDFTWSHDLSYEGPIATDLTPADYSITVQDDNGCMAVCELTVLPGASITIDEIQTTPSTCLESNGSIRVSATPKNDDPPTDLSYSIDGGDSYQSSSLFENLAAGTYEIVILDADGCMATEMIMLSDDGSPSLSLVAACAGTAIIDVIANVSGGLSPYSYLWIGPDGTEYSTDKLDGVPEGTYQLTVKDANGCQTSDMITREDCCNTINYCNKAIGQPVCADGTGTIIAGPVGAVYPFDYVWSHDPDLKEDAALELDPGNYFYTITDANGCAAECSASILSVAPIIISNIIVKNTGCGQTTGSLTIEAQAKDANPSSTLSYSIDGGVTFSSDNSFDNLAAGNYIIVVRDEDDCMTDEMAMISDEEGPQVDIAAKCDGLSLILEAVLTGGVEPFAYEWTGPNDEVYTTKDLMGVPQGSYMLTVKDANACQGSAMIIKEDCCETTEFCNRTINQPLCAGDLGYISFNPEGGEAPYLFTWSHDTAYDSDWANLESGDYTVTITDNAACESVCSFSINSVAIINIEQINTQASSCGETNGVIEVTAVPKDANANSMLSYSIDGGSSFQASNIFTNVAAGTYNILVQDMDGCNATEIIMVSDDGAPSIVLSASCLEAGLIEIDAEVNGGQMPYTFEWLGPDDVTYDTQNIANVPAGTYLLSVRDDNGCQASEMITKDDCCDPSNFCNMTLTQPICADDLAYVSLNPSGGAAPFDYTWSHDASYTSSWADDLVSGDYTITISDANACMTICSINITSVASISIEQIQTTASTCGENNGSIIIEATPKDAGINSTLSYSIDGGASFETSNIFANVAAGAYSILVQDEDGCQASEMVSISDEGSPSLQVEPSCNGANMDINLSISGGVMPYTIAWLGPDNQEYDTEDLSNVPVGAYTVSVKDANDCQAMESVIIDQCCETSNFCNMTINQPVCFAEPGSISLMPEGGEEPYTYSWDHDANLEDMTATNLVAGNYHFTITDAQNCEAACMATIEPVAKINVEDPIITPSTCGMANGSAQIIATPKDNTSTLTYSIDAGTNFQESPFFENLTAGNYPVVILDSDGCSLEKTLMISDVEGPVVSLASSCNGANIDLEASISGGTSPYTIEWIGPDGTNYDTEDLMDVLVGTYIITVKDANDCQTMDMITNDECCDNTGFCNLSLTSPVCVGDFGSIQISPEGGAAPYSYEWDHDSALESAIATNLMAGDYSILVLDAEACTAECFVTILPAAEMVISNISVTDAACGANNGTINILATPKNESSILQYSIDNGVSFQEEPLFTDLSPGAYDIVVKDEDDCETRAMQLISSNGGPVVSVDTECVGVDLISMSASVTDGTEPISYWWEGPNGFESDDKDLVDVLPGVYILSVKDANDCESMLVIEEDIDCCEMADFCYNEIGDFVWNDLNNNGLQDSGEPGIEGMEVRLFNCDGSFVKSTNTDQNGNYLFSEIENGDYRIQFNKLGFDNIGFSKIMDATQTTSNNDAQLNGYTSCFTISGSNKLDIDAALIDLAALGGDVWEDMDGNGVQDTGEPRIEGVRVEIYDADAAFVATEYTDDQGRYLFDGLYPGEYYLRFYSSNFDITFANQAGDDEMDSDIDNANGNGTTMMAEVALGSTNTSWDAGFYRCISLGDKIWYDENGNSSFESFESGINGIQVEVYYWFEGEYILWDDTFSDVNPANGEDGYWQLCVPPGDFYVQYRGIPDGMVAVKEHEGLEVSDSDIDETNGENTTASYQMLSGESLLDIDAGFFEEAIIEGKVWLDENYDGIREFSEASLADVTIDLYDVFGNLLATTTTDKEGNYIFNNQRCREVYIKVHPPEGYSITGANLGDDSIDNDIDMSFGENTSDNYTLESGSIISNVDVGLINIVVPILWQSITAQYKNESINVDWTLADQHAIEYFEIERSEDAIKFESIGTVAKDIQQEYTFMDKEIKASKMYYYRVKGVNHVSNSYTQIVSAQTPAETFEQLLIYPNPSNGQVILEFDLVEDTERLNIELLDSKGALVKSLTINEQMILGKQQLSLDLDVIPGVYQCRIKTKGIIYQESLIIHND